MIMTGKKCDESVRVSSESSFLIFFALVKVGFGIYTVTQGVEEVVLGLLQCVPRCRRALENCESECCVNIYWAHNSVSLLFCHYPYYKLFGIGLFTSSMSSACLFNVSGII